MISTRLALHAGTPPDPTTGAMLTPIYQTTTYRQGSCRPRTKDSLTVDPGIPQFRHLSDGWPHLKERSHVPVMRRAWQLRQRCAWRCCAPAAIALCVHKRFTAAPYDFFVKLLAPFGVQAEFVDTSDEEAFAAALRKPTRFVFIETPANPTLRLTDIRLAAQLSLEAGALLVVDNTLLTPALQRPFDFGADIVLHSTTKFIEGHNATVGGALITRDAELQEKLAFTRNAIGAIQSPFPRLAGLCKALRTLPLRMARHSENACASPGS